MPRPRLHLAAQAENAGMAQPVSLLEIVVSLVEDEERLAGQRRQTLLQALIKLFQARLERSQVGLVAGGIGRVDIGGISSHASRYQAGIGRQQPQVHINAAGTMIVVMLG